MSQARGFTLAVPRPRRLDEEVHTEHPRWMNPKARTVPGEPRTRHPKPQGGGRAMEWRVPGRQNRRSAYGDGYRTYEQVHAAWRRLEAAQLRGGLMEQQQALQDHYAPDPSEGAPGDGRYTEDSRGSQYSSTRDDNEHLVKESNALWTSLFAIVKAAAMKSGQTEKDVNDWLKPYLFEMQQDHFDTNLVHFSLSHPRLRLGDDGMRRVARWMIDNNAQLDGIQSVDFSRQGFSSIGLGFVADAIPLTVKAVEVGENTGYDWAEGILRLCAELRQRGGGNLYCGPANESDYRKLAAHLPSIPYPGHEVTVHVDRLGAMPAEIVVSSTAEEQMTFYADTRSRGFGSPQTGPSAGGYSGR
eukprot:TRINITY_DN12733_c0_g1_i1.p4 TRINITY_DN12733_c0_g1~~TRINITY_DN12733_c0_g1_i1.p4  ORF type:complete len:357 (+),score=113.58 TRINITY_DN12733_c0_g1_i1:75-1145(+)